MLSSVRNFFLALFISLIIFGIGAYFLINAIDGYINPDTAQSTTNPNQSSTEVPTDEHELNGNNNTSEFNVLLIGIDNGWSQVYEDMKSTGRWAQVALKKEADTILLMNINAKTKTFMISPLPSDMKVNVGGYFLRLGAVYREFGIDKLIDAVWAYTGIHVTPQKGGYHCILDYEGLEKVINILIEKTGEIEYNVPMDMKYKPDPYYITTAPPPDPDAPPPTTVNNDNTTEETTDIEVIDLKAGEQTIDGAKAIQLLRYRGYSNGNYDRMNTQVYFLKEIMRQKITFENLGIASELYDEIKECIVEANMDAIIFNKYAETIFSLMTDFKIKELTYPGTPKYNENGTAFYEPDYKSALILYKDYRISIFEREQIPEQGGGENQEQSKQGD